MIVNHGDQKNLIFIKYSQNRVVFEKDVNALKQALQDTEERIKKLKEHKESAKKQLGADTEETIRRLEHNLDKLQRKRELILKELE